MAYNLSFCVKHRGVAAIWVAVLLVAAPCAAIAQRPEMPPIPTPFPTPDFHFSDPVRDAEYWRLEGEVARTYAAFGRSVDAARNAVSRDAAVPGSPAWLRARAAVEQAIRDRRPARHALAVLIAFAVRERPQLPPAEAEYALDIRHGRERTLQATSDTLVNLLALLAGIRTGQWPA
ncbi:MAG TPA: hypothetical protein VK614_02755 [Allosphingosinicella sp.]|nr:hypothetical protein [Allosphingosinicella sp.]